MRCCLSRARAGLSINSRSFTSLRIRREDRLYPLDGLFTTIQPLLDLFSQIRHCGGQLVTSCRSFTQPERNAGGLAVRICDAHRALLHAKNSPGGISQLKDVALKTLDREVLVHGSDKCVL